MHCIYCGTEIEDDAKFCHSCGRQIAGAKAAQHEPMASRRPQGTRVNNGPAQDSWRENSVASQMEANASSQRKIPPSTIICLVLVAIACIAVIFVVMTSQGGQGGHSAQQQAQPAVSQTSLSATASGSAESQSEAAPATEPEPQMTDEERAVANINGWWSGAYHSETAGYQPIYGYIHDWTIDWYPYDPQTNDVSHRSSVRITRAERFSENGAEGWRFFTDASNDAWAYYQANGAENELPIYQITMGYGNIDSKSYNIYSVERSGIERVTDPSQIDDSLAPNQASIFAKAQAIAQEETGISAANQISQTPSAENSQTASTSAANAAESSNQAKAEAEAIDAARAAGEQVASGDVHVTTFAQRAQEVGMRTPDFANNNDTFVVLVLDEPTSLNGMPSPPTSPQARTVESIALGTSYASYGRGDSAGLDQWVALDGQHVTVAFAAEEAHWFSDTTGVLSPLNATSARKIAPLS